MQMADTDYNSLLARIKKVERQNRIWKMAGLLALLMLGVFANCKFDGSTKGSGRTVAC